MATERELLRQAPPADAVVLTNGRSHPNEAGQEEAPKINPDKRLIVIHLGGNGVGKGTSGDIAAELLEKEHGVKVVKISSGDAIRGSKDPNHPRFGKYHDGVEPYRERMKQGKLLPNSEVQEITRQQIADAFAEDGAQVVVVDGGIRTKEQLEHFQKVTLPTLREDLDVDYIGIHMYANKDTAVTRTRNRVRITEAQGGTVRDDDKNPRVVRRRFRIFERENPDIAEALAAEGRLRTISALPTGREVIGRQVGKVIFDALATPQRKAA